MSMRRVSRNRIMLPFLDAKIIFETLRLSFAKYVCLMCLLAVNFVCGLKLSYLAAIL